MYKAFLVYVDDETNERIYHVAFMERKGRMEVPTEWIKKNFSNRAEAEGEAQRLNNEFFGE